LESTHVVEFGIGTNDRKANIRKSRRSDQPDTDITREILSVRRESKSALRLPNCLPERTLQRVSEFHDKLELHSIFIR